MASRTEGFKKFARTLDKKSPYQDIKDLALKAVRTRFGPQSSLLASEDRLLRGGVQHRAGKFPWGTSRKDREEARRKEARRKEARKGKRERANSIASMPPAVNTGTPAINLLDVKDEEVEECHHTLRDHNNVAWPYYKDLSVILWAGNELIGNEFINEFIQSLGSTLFQDNTQGWHDIQRHIRTHAESFSFYRMNTSGHRGFMMRCKTCTRVCKLAGWSKKLRWDDDVLEANRVQLREFVGIGT